MEILNRKTKFNFEIIETDCKNNAINVVPKYAAITLKYTGNSAMPKFQESENIIIENIDNSTIKIISTGIALETETSPEPRDIPSFILKPAYALARPCSYESSPPISSSLLTRRPIVFLRT